MTNDAVPVALRSTPATAGLERPIRQLSGSDMFGIWAAATGPMAVASWLVAPRLAPSLGDLGLGKALILTLSAGLIWQFVLVVVLVVAEQRTLRWSALRDALWLNSPRSPTTGRTGGRLWWVLVPMTVIFAAEMLVPASAPVARDLGAVLGSPAGEAWLSGAWGWFAVVLVLVIFNTVLGEELLFRGYLLPRMQGRFGRWAWLVNGVAFATYHVHTPWVIPGALLDSLALSYPSQRYRSAWLGIIVHSIQSVFITAAVLILVLR